MENELGAEPIILSGACMRRNHSGCTNIKRTWLADGHLDEPCECGCHVGQQHPRRIRCHQVPCEKRHQPNLTRRWNDLAARKQTGTSLVHLNVEGSVVSQEQSQVAAQAAVEAEKQHVADRRCRECGQSREPRQRYCEACRIAHRKASNNRESPWVMYGFKRYQ